MLEWPGSDSLACGLPVGDLPPISAGGSLSPGSTAAAGDGGGGAWPQRLVANLQLGLRWLGEAH